MFKENIKHTQANLFGLYNTLSPKMQTLAEKSEEYFFYELIFSQIDEQIFSVLYSDKKSRPNAPINALVSALILMNRRGWTYEELFKQMQFNILIKVALGLDTLEEMPFSPATIFNFQNRINNHFIHSGENLLMQVFDKLTAKQLKVLRLKTNIQRTDSFSAASNIRNYSRLQLLVELIVRIWRVLSEGDKERFKSQFELYSGKSSGQYIYSLKSGDIPKELEKIGQLYEWIDGNLKDRYRELDIFQTFERVYGEHFAISNRNVRVKQNEELSTNSLQSPDDLDAAYRKKNNEATKGQSVNIVETAHPENPLNLVTDVDVNPVNKDDSVVLNERLDELKEKTAELDELHFDGAYGSEENDKKFAQHQITPIQTAVRGAKNAVEIEIEKEDNDEYIIRCPYQQVQPVKTRKRFKAEFNLETCSHCRLQKVCSTLLMKKTRVFYFEEKDYLSKQRQRAIKTIPAERRQLRNNVEATVNEFTCRLHKKKLKVRGLFKTTVFAYSVAMSVNFGRIYRYMTLNPELSRPLYAALKEIFKRSIQNCLSKAKFWFCGHKDEFHIKIQSYFMLNFGI